MRRRHPFPAILWRPLWEDAKSSSLVSRRLVDATPWFDTIGGGDRPHHRSAHPTTRDEAKILDGIKQLRFGPVYELDADGHVSGQVAETQ
jgi:hypothetical protein